MPPRPKIGSEIRGQRGRYRLEQEIADGNMSWALRAVDLNSGNNVFLKYYKSPTPTVSWYPAYLEYVAELNRKLDESAAAQYCVLAQDLFTANPRPGKCSCEFFYSVYEYIDSGYDLRKLMDAPGGIPWEKRKSMAKVFLAAMKKVHEAGVVHCDLKPENVQMLPREDTRLGLIPRMIDMDFSILAAKPAPWTTGSDKQGYTGTPGYFSPEHLQGQTPTTASDAFTVGLILGELLGGRHPFGSNAGDPDLYKQSVLASRFTPVRLMGTLGDTEGNAESFAKLIERCFSLQASQRPSCAQLHKELLALDKGAAGSSSAPNSSPLPPMPRQEKSEPMPKTTPAPAPEPEPQRGRRTVVCLTGDAGSHDVGISMDVGRSLLAEVSKDARFASRKQFHLERREGTWYISPCPDTLNPTALNGLAFSEETPLEDGDEIHLVGKSSGVKAMSIIVSLKPCD